MSKNLTRRDFVASLAALSGAAPITTLRAADPLQVGFVYVTPLAPLGWTAQHNEGRLQLERTLGMRVKTRYVDKVAEGADAERVIRDLAIQGCGLIVTTSFGYMEPTLKVARQFPKVVFEHISGYKSAANVGFANARFYEGRYLAGMVAAAVSYWAGAVLALAGLAWLLRTYRLLPPPLRRGARGHLHPMDLVYVVLVVVGLLVPLVMLLTVLAWLGHVWLLRVLTYLELRSAGLALPR